MKCENKRCIRCGSTQLTSKTRCKECLIESSIKSKERREKRITAGVCTSCGKNKTKSGKVSCETCLEYQRLKYSRYREQGLCANCGKHPSENGKLCSCCLKRTKDSRDDIKNKVFAHYGNKCNCCGETEPVFLSLDHVNNDGGECRRNRVHPRGGADLCRWIINNNYPNSFQILCHNCQWGKHICGECPHKQINRLAESTTAP